MSIRVYTGIRQQFVGLVYADHNRQPCVQKTIARVLAELPADGVGLNVGAGGSRLDPRVQNLDIVDGPNIDIVGRAEDIPLPDNSVDLVITQEALEHVADPFAAVREIHRVLKPGGVLYLQVPFIIGYHPGPTDFWRFTREGIVRLVEMGGLECTEIGTTVGASTGFYRISVEYFAILLSVPLAPLYIALKALFAVLLYPIKLLDRVTKYSHQTDRVAGGYYLLATKRSGSARDPDVTPGPGHARPSRCESG